MKSLYHRQFAMMISLVLLSFLLLGGAFAGLSYQYITADKRESMESNANHIASFTSSYLSNLGASIQDPVYQLYISSVANISGATVILSENDGQVVFAASAREEDLGALLRGTIPADVVNTVTEQGLYARPGNLGGLVSGKCYVVGVPCLLYTSPSPRDGLLSRMPSSA